MMLVLDFNINIEFQHFQEPPFPCDYCDESFDLRTDLKAHWRVHSDGNPHICQMCGKSFPDRMSYLQHSDLHDQVKPYRCPVCKKSFCYGSDLRKHAITHTGKTPKFIILLGISLKEKKIKSGIFYLTLKKFHLPKTFGSSIKFNFISNFKVIGQIFSCS